MMHGNRGRMSKEIMRKGGCWISLMRTINTCTIIEFNRSDAGLGSTWLQIATAFPRLKGRLNSEGNVCENLYSRQEYVGYEILVVTK